MLSKQQFIELNDKGRIASVRVAPVPFEDDWCIDAVVRMPVEAGTLTQLIAADADESADTQPDTRMRTFVSLDEAARFLKTLGVRDFTVDIDEAFAATPLERQASRVVETTMRLLIDNDRDEGAQPTTGKAAGF